MGTTVVSTPGSVAQLSTLPVHVGACMLAEVINSTKIGNRVDLFIQ